MKNQTAFTLIELLVVITLVIILTMSAIPNMRSMLINNRIVTKNNQLIHAINYARSEALIDASKIVQIQPIEHDDWSNGWEIVDATDDTVLKVFEFKNDGIEVTSEFPKLRYTSRGYLQSTITFNICNADYPTKGRQISVRRTGRANTETLHCN